MLAAGKMDRRVDVLRAAMVDDGLQSHAGTFEVIGTIWAGKVDVSDAERQRSAAVGAEITARFQIRSSTFTRSITPRDRLRIGARDYDIKGIKEIGRREGLEVSAVARADLADMA